jgi:hypothetical protein
MWLVVASVVISDSDDTIINIWRGGGPQGLAGSRVITNVVIADVIIANVVITNAVIADVIIVNVVITDVVITDVIIVSLTYGEEGVPGAWPGH